MKPRRHLKFAIIGGGKVGSVLGRILVDRGHVATAVVSRTMESARRAGRFLRCRNASQDVGRIPAETELIYITTPHDAIAEVAQALSGSAVLNFSRLSACHASGMHTAAALEPLAARGATTFSFHPLQTFPRDFPLVRIIPHIRGIWYGIDGTPAALRRARLLARELEGKTVVIPPEFRVLYHAACVVASNHLTTVLWIIQRMAIRLGVSEKAYYEMFKPIVQATLDNVAATSPVRALSGPVARGGVETVAGHFDSLRKFMPELIPYFATVTGETLNLAEQKGSIRSDRSDAMRRLLDSYAGAGTNKEAR